MSDLCLIDDLDEAIVHSSAMGQAVLGDAVESVRRAIVPALARHRWTMVNHASFRSWVQAEIGSSPVSPLIVDPLLNLGMGPLEHLRLRISRRLNIRTGQVELVYFSNLPSPAPERIAIVDDTSVSGRTIAGVATLLSGLGCDSSAVMLCTSSEESRRYVLRKIPSIQWRTMLVGDWRTIHLRDVFPLLPFAGRLVEMPSPELNGHTRRLCPVLVNGSAWQVLFVDSMLRETVKAAHDRVLRRLNCELGHPARVCDLRLLGRDVEIVSSRRDALSLETELEHLQPFHG